MSKKIQTYFFILSLGLGLVLLGSCSSSLTTPTSLAISRTITPFTTTTPDHTATADANYQATLTFNQTQNAAYFATSAAMKTGTSQARPPTLAPTLPFTATPTDEVSGVLINGKLVYHADIGTGLDEVDRIIDIVLASDMNEIRQTIKYTKLGCTSEMALGGPPSCRQGESDGAMVEVLPFLGPEGHFLRRDELGTWQGFDVVGLWAVYRVSDQAYSIDEYPAGEYGIVFRTEDPQTFVTFQVEYGSIVRIDTAFGTTPELIFERDADQIILPPPNTDSGCPGASPQRVILGEKAVVCTESDDLIVRKGPGMDGAELRGLQPGTNLRIISGPLCANNWYWWKVELDSGLAGWVAEGGDEIDPYFICPLE